MRKRAVVLSIGSFEFKGRPEPRWEGQYAFSREPEPVAIEFYGAEPPTEERAQHLARLADAYDALLSEIHSRLVDALSSEADLLGDEFMDETLDDPSTRFSLETISILDDGAFDLSYGIRDWDDAICTVCLRNGTIEAVHLAD